MWAPSYYWQWRHYHVPIGTLCSRVFSGVSVSVLLRTSGKQENRVSRWKVEWATEMLRWVLYCPCGPREIRAVTVTLCCLEQNFHGLSATLLDAWQPNSNTRGYEVWEIREQPKAICLYFTSFSPSPFILLHPPTSTYPLQRFFSESSS